MIHTEDLLFDNIYPILVNPSFLNGDRHFRFQMNFYFRDHMPTHRRIHRRPPAVDSTFYNSPEIYIAHFISVYDDPGELTRMMRVVENAFFGLALLMQLSRTLRLYACFYHYLVSFLDQLRLILFELDRDLQRFIHEPTTPPLPPDFRETMDNIHTDLHCTYTTSTPSPSRFSIPPSHPVVFVFSPLSDFLNLSSLCNVWPTNNR